MIDVFNNNVIAAAATTTIWTPAANSTIGIYRVNIACDAAQTVQITIYRRISMQMLE